MSTTGSSHRRIQATLWFIAVLFLLLTAVILGVLRADVADTRIESRVSHFSVYASAQPGASAAEVIHSFLAAQIPDSDEVLAGVIEGRVVRMERAGRGLAAGDRLYTAVVDGDGSVNRGRLDDVHYAAVTVLDAQGETALLVSAVDTAQRRAQDRTLLALLTMLVVLSTSAVSALTRPRPLSGPPADDRTVTNDTESSDTETSDTEPTHADAGTDADTACTAHTGAPAPRKQRETPAPKPGQALRDIMAGAADRYYSVGTSGAMPLRS